MDLTRSFHTKFMSRTMFSPSSTSRCKSDPQPYIRRREPTPTSLVSGRDLAPLLPLSCSPSSVGKIESRQELLNSLNEFPGEPSISAIAAAEKRRHHEILDLTKEIEKLSSENIQLKKETFTADFNYMNMIDQLATKDSEIEDLRNELSELSEQISMSTAKEEEYINTARSCMNLEEKIEGLQKELAIQKKDFEQLATAHAACPSPEEMGSALKEVKSTYKTHLAAIKDQLSERDRLIAALEESIAKKDEDLKEMAGELTRQQSDCDVSEMQRQELDMRLTEMDSVVQDRERLIGNMKILMDRKSVKVNLLLLRIKELEVKLEVYRKQLREFHQVHGSRRPTSISNDVLDFEHLRNTCSLENLQKSIKREWNQSYHGAGDSNVEEYDSQGLLDETSKLQSDFANASIMPSDHDPARLLFKINNIKSKIRHKLNKEIRKRSQISETIGVSRHQFDQTQSEIEEIRKHQQNAEESRQQIRSRVYQEKRLSKIMRHRSSQYMLVLEIQVGAFGGQIMATGMGIRKHLMDDLKVEFPFARYTTAGKGPVERLTTNCTFKTTFICPGTGESSENESRAISAKLASFERALRNLENLECFLVQTENKT